MLDATVAPLVQVRDLKMHFPIYSGVLRRQSGAVKAVDGISFDIRAGETLGLVGESGCGKSTVGRALIRLYEPTAGSVTIAGDEITTLPPEALRKKRPQMQMVFQDPQASLNPRMTLAQIIGEPLVEHSGMAPDKRLDRIYELMDQVGLNRRFANRYPHEFSGGQRQRIGIARALAVEPKLLVLDEPVSALDVSVQAQVVNLLEDIQERTGVGYLFIAHDMGVVRHVADRIAVMYLGRIVEEGPAEDVCTSPRHPYTRMLIASVPALGGENAEPLRSRGELPSPLRPPSGCAFHPRCPLATETCSTSRPILQEKAGRRIACSSLE
jgi:oligopeptide transport system ATP-binding protein